jgi:NADH:ubiquinone oxidoreductase subunit K
MLTININFILSLTCIVFFIGLLGIILNRKKYFNHYNVN